ncbi:MATE family efflux transporter [Sporosalibacterium faouarense]|uniref:MATE family efflux transporter n=1 Tax=Sporosalibacterium faouarense TaxID=516123 RepID=UPI00141C1140|nr:MATE family efflux transporter [Sporosalibacterium faouarense]MTI47146.1 MATE family efflux transporter [Bacillota bacterium]
MKDTHLNANKKEVRRKIYSMILPITMENILVMVAGFVSMGMLGRIDTLAIGAFGLSDRLTKIIWALFKGVTMGASVFVAQAYGSQNHSRLKKVIQQTLLSSIILVILLQQFVFWKAPMLLGIYNPDPNLMHDSIAYLRIVSWGLPFLAIMLVVAGVLQGMGNARTPMLIALIMNITNIIFGYGFIFGNFGLPKLGLKGAAIATIISQVTAAMLGIYVLFNKKGVLSTLLNKRFFKLDIKEVLSIYKVGMPSALESIFWQVSSIILTKIIMTFGNTALAAYQVGLQAESISYMPAAGFSIAATAFIGQALGARKEKLGRTYLKETIKGSMIITSLSVILLVGFPHIILGLLTNQADVIKLGSIYLVLMGIVQIPQNLSGVLNGALRGAGHTRVPMFVAGAGLWIVRIPISLILTYWLHMDIVAIWVVMCFDLVFRFVLSLILYKTKNIYKTELVLEKN